MTEIDKFKFEDKDYDFPFYKKNPYIPKWGWIVLLIAFLIGTIFSFSNKLIFGILGCIVFIVPVLYFLKWDYKAIFRMPSRRDIALAIALFVGYMLYAVAVDMILSHMGIVSSGLVEPETVTIMTMISTIFFIMCEEFLKFIPFMFLLRVIYKYSNNRKLSIILSVALIMLMFASLHAFNPIMFIFALFMQGFGSIFEFYAYIKTKNVLVSYLCHLFTDEFVYLIALLGFA